MMSLSAFPGPASASRCSFTSWTLMMSAPFRSGAAFRAMVAGQPVLVAAVELPDERLPRKAHEHREPELPEFVEILYYSGNYPQAFFRNRCPDRRLFFRARRRLQRPFAPPPPGTRVFRRSGRRTGGPSAWFPGVPWMCMTTRPAPCAATTAAIFSSKVRPLISLTMEAPRRRAARATPTCSCRRKRACRCLRDRLDHRAHPVDFLRRRTPASRRAGSTRPPMSMMSAPSSRIAVRPLHRPFRVGDTCRRHKTSRA